MFPRQPDHYPAQIMPGDSRCIEACALISWSVTSGRPRRSRCSANGATASVAHRAIDGVSTSGCSSAGRPFPLLERDGAIVAPGARPSAQVG
jgi:hypothetical protein